jgi:hypothetical protein
MSKELETFDRVWEDCSKLDLDYVSKHNLMDDNTYIVMGFYPSNIILSIAKFYKSLEEKE